MLAIIVVFSRIVALARMFCVWEMSIRLLLWTVLCSRRSANIALSAAEQGAARGEGAGRRPHLLHPAV